MKKLYILPVFLAVLLAMPAMAQQDPPRSTFYDRQNVRDRVPVELPTVREADVLWSKLIWQEIDLRQTINQALYFPAAPDGHFKNLMQVLMDALLEGEIRAYDRNDHEFRRDPYEANMEALFNEFRPVETVGGQDILGDFSTQDVYTYRIKEEWFVDAHRGMMDVRIIGIKPLWNNPIEVDNPPEPMFWIPFEEARVVLVNSPVLNRHNDAQEVSFDDYFLRRQFSARIIEEQRPDVATLRELLHVVALDMGLVAPLNLSKVNEDNFKYQFTRAQVKAEELMDNTMKYAADSNVSYED